MFRRRENIPWCMEYKVCHEEQRGCPQLCRGTDPQARPSGRIPRACTPLALRSGPFEHDSPQTALGKRPRKEDLTKGRGLLPRQRRRERQARHLSLCLHSEKMPGLQLPRVPAAGWRSRFWQCHTSSPACSHPSVQA